MNQSVNPTWTIYSLYEKSFSLDNIDFSLLLLKRTGVAAKNNRKKPFVVFVLMKALERLIKGHLVPSASIQGSIILRVTFVFLGQRPAHLKTMRKRRRKFWVRMTMSKKIQRITSKVRSLKAKPKLEMAIFSPLSSFQKVATLASVEHDPLLRKFNAWFIFCYKILF